MAGSHLLAQVRKGMEVHAADGTPLGTIAHVWFGVDPLSSDQQCDEEACSRLEVRLRHRGGTVYIPYSAISDVSGKHVQLSVDPGGVHKRSWQQRPAWMPPDEANQDLDHLFRPHLGAE